ncbi:hypothetical protein C8Q70DRAFT_947706 [Cubamyces menziesii]|nr:hypothetical protein C8Q70DRAFT_947706 [Cubamyces menziesii]
MHLILTAILVLPISYYSRTHWHKNTVRAGMAYLAVNVTLNGSLCPIWSVHESLSRRVQGFVELLEAPSTSQER